MFNFKYKEHDYIFNHLVKLSRNIFFYKDIKLDDKLENRVTLIFAHLSIIIKNLNKKKEYKNVSQEIYDNIFHNLENNLRELGHGDVTVNKKMKLFNRMFHDILIKFIDEKNKNLIKINEIYKFLFKNDENEEIKEKLTSYFKEYHNFCFDIVNKNMIKEIDKFEY